jgi:exonuclease VII small subunit
VKYIIIIVLILCCSQVDRNPNNNRLDFEPRNWNPFDSNGVMIMVDNRNRWKYIQLGDSIVASCDTSGKWRLHSPELAFKAAMKMNEHLDTTLANVRQELEEIRSEMYFLQKHDIILINQ